MKLIDYLNLRSGAAATLAKNIGVPPALMSQWRNGVRQVPIWRCLEIEKATDGEVTCEDLRSDVDWGYLRRSARSDEERKAA